jgi:Ca2+-binding EF-hand superfamily protein
MKTLFTALVATIALGAAPARAQSDAQHILEAVFQSFDENHDGFITSDEANRFIEKTFAEMDVKHTGKISRDAWMRFSFGLADLAADQGRSDAYDLAK